MATMVQDRPGSSMVGAALGAAARAAEEVKRAWRAGRPADAAAALKARPSLAKFRSVVVGLAYEEFCLKWEAGAPPEPAALAAKFPEFKSSIARVIEAHLLFADHPEILAPATWPAPSDRVEGLEVVAELGRGAFGRAYLAFDPDTARSCVLKLSAGGGAEARVIARLRHPHVTDVYWARSVGGRTGVCMPLLGVTTLEHVRDMAFGPGRAAYPGLSDVILSALDPERIVPGGPPAGRPVVTPGRPYPAGVAAVMARVAGALAHAHRAGVTHGDVKPSNFVLGPGGHPYLIDFNLASVAAGPAGRAGGTLPYMAPEVLESLAGPGGSAGPCPPSADVYSFGVTLFELLTGQVPYHPGKGQAGEVAAELLQQIRTGKAHVRTLAPHVPAGLAAVAEDCLAADPERRPTDLDAVRQRLEGFIGDRPAGRWRPLALAAGAAAVATAVVVSGLTPSPKPIPPEALEFVKLSPEEHLARGIVYLKDGRLASAQDEFVRANVDPTDGRATAYIAYCAARRAQTDVGLNFGQEALKQKETAATHNIVGYCLLRRGGAAQAIVHFDKALDLQSGMRPALYNRAMAKYAAGLDRSHRLSDRGAADDMGNVLTSGPVSAKTYFDAGTVFAATPGMQGEAIRCLKESARLGSDPAGFARLPNLRANLGDIRAFEDLCRAAPVPPPNDAPPHYGSILAEPE